MFSGGPGRFRGFFLILVSTFPWESLQQLTKASLKEDSLDVAVSKGHSFVLESFEQVSYVSNGGTYVWEIGPAPKKTPRENLTVFAVLQRDFHPLFRHSNFEHLTMPASADFWL